MREELVRHLDEDACAVTRARVCTSGAAVAEVDQHLEALVDDFVGALALDAGHQTDPAGIVLHARVVQTLLG